MNPDLLKVKVDTFEKGGWVFTAKKGPMMATEPLDDLSQSLGLSSCPEVIYSKNLLSMTHKETGFTYYISAFDGLKYLSFANRKISFEDPTEVKETSNLNSISYVPENLEVALSKYWKNKQVPGDVEIDTDHEFTSDWTFTTPYKGTFCNTTSLEERIEKLEMINDNPESKYQFVQTDQEMPKHKLGQNNPIRAFFDVFLWEDDLGDFGQAQFRVRCRVMDDCAFALVRSYVRNDNATVRICDTRVYVDFEEDTIFREFSVRENTYDELRQKGFRFTPQFNLSPDGSDMIFQLMDVKLKVSDTINFKA